jgi:hypothetical protein
MSGQDFRVQIQIQAAREYIAGRADGPLTLFVLISRACQGAADRPILTTYHPKTALLIRVEVSSCSAWANALDDELRERGFITEMDALIEEPRS